jgi:hypothetical protein
MSITNNVGWANREIITEGLLHSDALKQRITNLFQRTSLGNSPTYLVGKISQMLKAEKGEGVDINQITDEDITRIANLPEVTKGKFSPQLKNPKKEETSSQEEAEKSFGIDSKYEDTPEVPNSQENGYTTPTIKKESIRLSPTEINRLMMEAYRKRNQHNFLTEQKFRQ